HLHLLLSFPTRRSSDLTILRNSRYIQTVVILLFAVVAFYFLQVIINHSIAFLSISLAIISPFFLGHARLLNHEGMLAMFALVSLDRKSTRLNSSHVKRS